MTTALGAVTAWVPALSFHHRNGSDGKLVLARETANQAAAFLMKLPEQSEQLCS
jgi:hypothetical protein